MEVQEPNVKTRMVLFPRVTTKQIRGNLTIVPKKFAKKIHTESISQNGCNSTSRHDFLLKFSVNTQN